MLPARYRPSLSRIAGVLLCGLVLVSLAACNYQSPPTVEPSPAGNQASSLRHFPGVDVIRTATGGVRFRIISGLAAEGEPLYVVDGTPVTVSRGRGLDWLSPEQIERVDVLKYPAETALYGPRGVNGVLLITTTRSR